jgi:hypothetical protein
MNRDRILDDDDAGNQALGLGRPGQAGRTWCASMCRQRAGLTRL